MINKHRMQNRRRVKTHIRLKITGTAERPRLTVYRSLKHVYAQIVDDVTGKTLVAVSDLSKELKEQLKDVKGQMKLAKQVGQLTARKAMEKNIKEVVFDRNGFVFHGVVKAMADGAREAGLKF
jgi:large subunit ribosomal protein L18